MENVKAACKSDSIRRDSIESESVKSDSDESDVDSQKLDLSVQNSKGNTPLHEIVDKTYTQKTPGEIQKLEESDIKIIKLMLKFKTDVGLRNSKGYTSVHLAIKNKRSDALVKVLLDHGGDCDYNFTDKEGCTALYYAVSPISYKFTGNSSAYSNFNFKFKDESIINYLIKKGANTNIPAKNGYSPLLLAVVMQKTDYVRVMCEKENKLSDGGLEQTIDTFFCKVICGREYRCYPPDEYYGMTPLLAAVYDNNKEMAQILINAGADVNAINRNNKPCDNITPLLISACNFNLEMANILICAGADVNTLYEKGDNVLHRILKGTHFFAYSEKRWGGTEEPTEIAKLFIDHGINLNAKDQSGETALHLALRNDKKDLAEHILAQGQATL